jgi:hypothetical protein
MLKNTDKENTDEKEKETNEYNEVNFTGKYMNT